MIKVLFFAQVRELVGTDSLTLDASELATVEAVRQLAAPAAIAGAGPGGGQAAGGG